MVTVPFDFLQKAPSIQSPTVPTGAAPILFLYMPTGSNKASTTLTTEGESDKGRPAPRAFRGPRPSNEPLLHPSSPETTFGYPQTSLASKDIPSSLIAPPTHKHRPLPPHPETSIGCASPTLAQDGPAHVHHVSPNGGAQDKCCHKKSIKEVAAEHKERISRTSRLQHGIASFDTAPGSRSTNLWGVRAEGEAPSQANAIIDPFPLDLAKAGDSPASKPSFKWVRGEPLGGRMFIALNVTTGETIVAKQVGFHRAGGGDENIHETDALRREFAMLKDLDHPNIVRYLGFEETPSFISLFMEHVPGGTLRDRLQNHVDDDIAKSYSAQILDGLEHMHSNGILHRNLRAGHILVDSADVCKISHIDWRHPDEDTTALDFLAAEQNGVFWMAPEVVISGGRTFTPETDIWSFGCVMLEMWTGERPWLDEDALSVVVKLYSTGDAPPVPSDVTLSPEAEEFGSKCFAEYPDDRASAGELRRHAYLGLAPN